MAHQEGDDMVWEDIEPTPDRVVDIDLYHTTVLIFFSAENADLYMHEMLGSDDSFYQNEIDSRTTALAFQEYKDGETTAIGVIFPSPPNGGVLAHECLHLVDFICDNLSIDICLETTEPRAYLLQYLFDKMEEHISDWKKEHPEWENQTKGAEAPPSKKPTEKP